MNTTKMTTQISVIRIKLPIVLPFMSLTPLFYAQSRKLENTHPTLPASTGTIFDQTFPETRAASRMITLVSLCRAPRIVPFGRLRTFNGVPVGSATTHVLTLETSACAEPASANAVNIITISFFIFLLLSSFLTSRRTRSPTRSLIQSPTGVRPLSIIHWWSRFLVALRPVRDLFLCAKHLF